MLLSVETDASSKVGGNPPSTLLALILKAYFLLCTHFTFIRYLGGLVMVSCWADGLLHMPLPVLRTHTLFFHQTPFGWQIPLLFSGVSLDITSFGLLFFFF